MPRTRVHPDEGVRLDQRSQPPPTGPQRSGWTWFWAAFSVVLLAGVSILYLAGRPDDEIATPVADAPEPPDTSAADDAQPASDPIPIAAAQASAVLLGTYVVDSFGFHALEETYADATEVGERDADNVSKVITAIDVIDWPEELTDLVATLRTDLTGLVAALEAGDVDTARAAFAAVHASQHDFSNGVYVWLRGEEPMTSHADSEKPATGHADDEEPATSQAAGEGSDAAGEVIEIDMFEFGYAPESIEIAAGVPTVLRFTNSGRLQHEAMVGDAHMQEEFASADNHDDDAGDDHHGDLMAVTLDPGESADMEVLLEEPGTWYFACHLTGHYEQGQVATINVTG